MVYKNFSKYNIDIENQVVFSNAFNKKRELKMSETSDGYIRCGLTDDKGNSYYRWHQVVYCVVNGITKDEFPKDENGVSYEIDHIDNNKKNNNPNNLRLVSKKDQMNNEITLETLSNASFQRMSDKVAREKISKSLRNRTDESKSVKQLTLDGELIAIFPSMSEAARHMNTNVGHISECCNGFRKTCKGYKWMFDLI